MSKIERKQFTFYRSFWEAAAKMRKKPQQEYLVSVINYALNGVEPEVLSPDAQMAFSLTRPTLDASWKKTLSGQKGGKQNGSKTEANGKQNESKIEKEVEVEVEKEVEIEKESFSFTGGEAPIQGEDRRLRLPTKENEFFVIYPASVVQWEKQYPSVDVVRELGQMADWCRKNPGKRKSKSEMLPFVARWLRRAQEKGEEDRGADEPIAPGDDGEQIAILRRLADRARRKEEERC